MSLPRPYASQLAFDEIFDGTRLVRNTNSVRALTGNFIEEVICSAMRLDRLKTDSRCPICPDAKAGKRYYEIKSCGKDEAVIFIARLEKEVEFAKSHPFAYVLLRHRSDFSGVKTSRDVYQRLVEGIHSAHVVPLSAVQRVCDRPLDKANIVATSSAYVGWAERGYARGYWRAKFREFESVIVRRSAKRKRWQARGLRGTLGVIQYDTITEGTNVS